MNNYYMLFASVDVKKAIFIISTSHLYENCMFNDSGNNLIGIVAFLSLSIYIVRHVC